MLDIETGMKAVLFLNSFISNAYFNDFRSKHGPLTNHNQYRTDDFLANIIYSEDVVTPHIHLINRRDATDQKWISFSKDPTSEYICSAAKELKQQMESK